MTRTKQKLKAPFPWFGGKQRVASLVWDKLGDVPNFIEPFAGSAAMLLLRPHPGRIETINDADCYVANFWRATSRDPEAVAEHADGPVNEVDLHARHRWLVLSPAATDFRERMRTDPDYFDPKVAGWWCWGLCCWIGSGWCDSSRAGAQQIPYVDAGQGRGVNAAAGNLPSDKRPILAGPANEHGERSHLGLGVHAQVPDKRPQLHTGNSHHGRGVHGEAKGPSDQLPRLAGAYAFGGLGVHADKVPDGHRPQLADAYSRGRGVHGNDDAGTCEARRAWLVDWFGRLRDRLRTVRVCCGDWTRVCSSDSVTTRLGRTGVFLDPPYSTEAGRTAGLYGVDCGQVAHAVRAYCLERGDDPRFRICLAGYAGEGHEGLEARGWAVVAWKASGGYGNRSAKGKANAGRERLWFSPHCLGPERDYLPLFDSLATLPERC